MKTKIHCDVCKKEMSIPETHCDEDSGLELCAEHYEEKIIEPLREKLLALEHDYQQLSIQRMNAGHKIYVWDRQHQKQIAENEGSRLNESKIDSNHHKAIP